MTPATLVQIGALSSIWLIVWSLGAATSLSETREFLRRPASAIGAMAAIFLVVPVIAILLTAVLPLPGPAKFAIVAMSIGPAPPILPVKQIKAGSAPGYALGLLVAAAIGSILFTPLLVHAASQVLSAEAYVTMGEIARVLALSVALPLALGFATNALFPKFAAAAHSHAQRIGFLVLLAILGAACFVAWRPMMDLIGDGTLAVMALMSTAAVAVGHLLGDRENRTALGLASASRHPGVALAIAAASFPSRRAEILAAVLLYLLVTMLVTAVYLKLARRPSRATSPG